MRKTLSFLLSIILCAVVLAGCASEKQIDYTDTYVEGQDSQENLIEYQGHKYFSEADNCLYFINNDFLYVIDETTQKCRPLCNKSDCLHDKEVTEKTNCNAYLGLTYEACMYYDGYIYFQTDEQEKDKDGVTHTYASICKISLESNERQTVYRTDEYNIFDVKLHRGYLYLNVAQFGWDGSAQDDTAEFFRLDLNGGTEPELIVPMNQYREQYQNMVIVDFRFYGNHLFLDLLYTDPEEKTTLINFDLNTKEWNDLGEKIDYNIDGFFTVFKDSIFYGNDGNIYKCDLNGDNARKVLNCKKYIKGYKYFEPFTNDGRNVIISVADDDGYSDKIIFCDEKGKAVVKEMPIEYSAKIGFDKDFFIYQKNKDENTPIYLIDKNDFTMKKLYDFPKDK